MMASEVTTTLCVTLPTSSATLTRATTSTLTSRFSFLKCLNPDFSISTLYSPADTLANE